VVGPSKNHYVTWRSEVEQTTDWTSVKYHGTPAKRKKLREAGFKDNVVFTTYTILHELVGQEFDFVIFDEAHTLAHKETKAFKNAQKMLKSLPGVPLLLLSGTPILHKPRDLWALIHLIDPQMAGDFHTWTKRYEKVVQTIVKKIPIKSGGGYQTDERGRIKLRTIEIPIKVVNQNTEELADLTKSIIFRRKLSDHVKFKDRVEVEKVEMLPRQLEMYREAREELYLELSNKQLKLSSGILGRITRFLQICEGCFNLDPTITDSAKYDLLFDELDNAQGKVIVWSRFLPGSKLLYEKYKDRAVLYNGELTEHQRNVSIWNFQGCNNAQDQKEWEKLNKTSFKEPGQAQFMFGTMGDITANLNLPACDYQIVTSFLWNGSKVEQTLSRIKRLTQESDEVYSKIILCESPRNFEENAFKLMMSNHLTTLEILDGKGDQGYIKVQELLNLV
jgi:SNF2 family DNA or RNA helicase